MEGGKKRFDCLSTREYEVGGEKKTAWTRIGVAFENRDGSLSVLLDSLPVDGKLQIRAYEPRDRANGNGNERPVDRVSEPARHEAGGRGGNGRRKIAPAEEAF